MSLRLDFNAEIKAQGDTGRITGLASMFGNKDLHGDVIEKGAFAGSLKKMIGEGRKPAMLDHHKMDSPVGVWESIEETDRGLEVSGRLTMGVGRAKELHALAADGALDGLSIGFRTIGERFEKGTRIIEEIDLWEISLVSMPANEEARIESVKNALDIQSIRDFERALRDQLGFSAGAAKSIASQGWKSADPRDAAALLLADDQQDVASAEFEKALSALSTHIRNNGVGK